MSSLSRVAIVIPAYKPAPDFVEIVRKVQFHGYGRILVVNDGEADSDPGIFARLREFSGVEVLTHAVNLGKGAALKFAFNHILVNCREIEGVVTMDADGQHAPDDVLAVARALLAKPGALILGARGFQEDVPFRSRVGNTLTRYLFHFLTGKKLGDTQTGLRGIPMPMLRKLIPLKASRYEFELDMLVLAAGEKMEIQEVQISTIYLDGNKGSHFNPFMDSFRIYFVFARFIFVSFVTFFVDTLTFFIAFNTTGQLFYSMAVGRGVGLVVNLFGTKAFVFKSKDDFAWELVKYLILVVSLFSISYTLMLLLVDRWHFHVLASRIVVDMGLFLANFAIQRDLVFSKKWRLSRKE